MSYLYRAGNERVLKFEREIEDFHETNFFNVVEMHLSVERVFGCRRCGILRR